MPSFKRTNKPIKMPKYKIVLLHLIRSFYFDSSRNNLLNLTILFYKLLLEHIKEICFVLKFFQISTQELC